MILSLKNRKVLEWMPYHKNFVQRPHSRSG
jgi:hypothetical protein